MNTQHAALDITVFDKTCSQQVSLEDFPLASQSQLNVLCY